MQVNSRSPLAALLIVASAGCFCPSAQSAESSGGPPAYQRSLRDRASSDPTAPIDAHLRSLAQKGLLPSGLPAVPPPVSLSAKGPFQPAAATAPGNWTSVGPLALGAGSNPSQTYSGKVDDIALDPTNPNIVYIGTDSGGVWKSTDAGAHWIPLTDAQPLLGIGALAIDPGNPRVLYAGTGGNYGFYLSAGILKTTDAGATWTNISTPFTTVGRVTFRQLAVSPHNSAIVLAATDYGLWRSSDAGITWQHFGLTNVDSVAFDKRTPGVAYYTVSYFGDASAGLYKSADSGANWTHIGTTGANPLPASQWLHPRVFVDPSSALTLYVQMVLTDFSKSSAQGAIYKSTDGGSTWAPLPTPPLCCQTYMNQFAIHPTNPNVLYAGNLGFYRSLNGGATWNSMDASTGGGTVVLHADHHALALNADGSVLYEGNDGGIYRTDEPASPVYNWVNLNDTLSTVMFHPGLSIDPGNLSRSFAGTQDNGTARYGGVPRWNSEFSCGDGGYTYIDPVNTNNVLVSCANRASIYRSSSGGSEGSFVLTNSGIVTTEPIAWPPPLVADSLNPRTLYFGTRRVYQSTDQAASWTPISPDLTLGLYTNSVITTLAVAPGDSNTVYAGTGESRVQVTNNALAGAAAVWQDITNGLNIPPPGKGSGYLDFIAVDPVSASTAYVGVYGFNTRHVLVTRNRGQSWQDISGNLPDTPINTIVVDPDLPRTLYVGTEIGAFWTDNEGSSWRVLGSGLPNVIVNALVLHGSTRTLRAATYGRGAWDLAVPLPPPLAASAGSLTFSDQVVGTTGAAQVITLTNTRRTPLPLASITTTGDYVTAQTCGTTLPAGENCSINVSFRPVGADARAGSLTITAGNTPTMVTLTGRGTITASLAADKGAASTGQAVTLTWNAQSVATCTASGGASGDGWTGSRAATGTATVTEPAAGTYTYLIDCTAGTQTVRGQVAVTFSALPTVTVTPASSGGGALDLIAVLALLCLRALRRPVAGHNLRVLTRPGSTPSAHSSR